MADQRGDTIFEKGKAGSALPPAGGSQPARSASTAALDPDPAIAERDADLADPTRILNGAKAFIGRAAMAASRMGSTSDAIALYNKHESKRKRDEEEAQLARLAAWGARKTVICGVEMTNAEAQEARQRVIDNDEMYAKWAVARGYIGDDEKDAFKRDIRRKKDLEDKRGRGTITEAEEREARAIDRSHVGAAVDAATADSHLQFQLQRKAALGRNDANATLRQESSSAPQDSAELFQNKQTATPIVDPAKTAVAERVKATGLDL